MNHSAIGVWLLSHYTLLVHCVLMCVCCPIFASVLCIAQLCAQLPYSVGSPTAGGWRYLLGVMTHSSSRPSPWSKQKVVRRWREGWCSGGTSSPTCWRQSVASSGCTEEVPWREADGWVGMLLCLCVCIMWVQVWLCPYVCVCVYVFEYTMIGCWVVLLYKLISSVRGCSFLLDF